MRIEIPKLNDVWLDNGIVTFYELLKRINFDENLVALEVFPDKLVYQVDNLDLFIEEFADNINSRKELMLVNVEDKQTGARKEVKKEHILIQEGKKIAGKVAFKENLFDDSNTLDVVKEIFNNIDGDKYSCFFCNRKFKKNIKNIQQASYPFVTKIKSLSGIRTGYKLELKEYISEYCPQCYLLGILEWLDESMVYRTIPGDKSIIILPNTENLTDLIELKNSYKKLLKNRERWSNIKIDIDKSEIDNTYGRYTTFISFYENFLRYIEPKFDNDNWYIIEVPQSGSVKNPKYFNLLLDKRISRLLKILTRQHQQYFYRIFIKQFYAFYVDPKKGIRDFDTENALREVMCKALIKNDFESFAKSFVPQKGIKPGIPKGSYEILNNLIKYWRIEPMKIENKDEYLKTLGMASATLARLIGGRLGLFFKLEKANNPNQLFEALQEITRRIVIDEKIKESGIYPSSIEKISQMILEKYDEKDGKEFFTTTKNILLIYTSLRSKKENKNNKEEKNE